jgi:hypothetical protein
MSTAHDHRVLPNGTAVEPARTVDLDKIDITERKATLLVTPAASEWFNRQAGDLVRIKPPAVDGRLSGGLRPGR